MGYTIGSDLFLYAEETLFLVNNNLTNVYYKNNIITLPYLYHILSSKANVSLFCFTVYSQFIKAGYILRRHKFSEITEQEK